MNHPSERLFELINSLSLNINSFSSECGYPLSATIWKIIEQKKPSNPTINKIRERFPQVNRKWLLTGHGEMFANQQTDYSEDLTVTAKQVIETIVPKMLKVGLVEKAESLISKLEQTISRFESISENIKIGSERLTSIEKQIKSMERMQAVEIIKEAKKKRKNEVLCLLRFGVFINCRLSCQYLLSI